MRFPKRDEYWNIGISEFIKEIPYFCHIHFIYNFPLNWIKEIPYFWHIHVKIFILFTISLYIRCPLILFRKSLIFGVLRKSLIYDIPNWTENLLPGDQNRVLRAQNRLSEHYGPIMDPYFFRFFVFSWGKNEKTKKVEIFFVFSFFPEEKTKKRKKKCPWLDHRTSGSPSLNFIYEIRYVWHILFTISL